MKACKVCHIVKENSEFYLCAGRKGGKPRKPYYDKRCKKCSVKRLAKWRLENYGKYIAKKRKWDRTPQGKLCAWKYHLRITYGITTEQYSEKVISQSGRCMICNGNPSKNGLRVDHDHGTGKVRDLLCDFCDQVLGYVEKHRLLLSRCGEYLEVHEQPKDRGVPQMRERVGDEAGEASKVLQMPLPLLG